MPWTDYHCDPCGYVEKDVAIPRDGAPVPCPHCGEPMRREYGLSKTPWKWGTSQWGAPKK